MIRCRTAALSAISLLGGAAVAQADAAAPPSPEQLLQSLTLEEKAGQLFVSWTLASSVHDADKLLQLQRWVTDVGLGGVIVSLGTVQDAAELLPKLQAAAKLPLLMAGDFEGGVAFRLQGATDMGNQMLVGATGLPRLAQAMGEVTGREAKALGFHWVFAPVLDVNSNPANPIINVRSFGEDPARVAAMGAAFAQGVRSQGLASCGKHFPGHGDVDSDSHLQLPTVPGDRQRLHRVELLPFAVASRQGLESVMTGHLAVPGLGEDPTVPATLSAKILGGVLRSELGFQGLIVTDALDMGGVRNKLPPGEVAVRALAAGADVLLMPPDPLAARAAVIAAVQDGRVEMARLDDAVLRILRLKQRVGLLAGGGRTDQDWQHLVAQPAAQAVADEIAERGITLVQDDGGLLPLPRHASALLLQLFDRRDDDAGVAFAAALHDSLGEVAPLSLSADSSAAEVEAAVGRLQAAETVVLALHVKVRSYSGRIGVPTALQPVLAALRPAQHSIAVSFGNPYLIADLPAVTTYLCTYAGGARIERAAAAALLGEASVTGRLPVSIPGRAAAGHGLSWYPGNGVRTADPLSEGMAADLPQRLRALLQQGIADHVAPGMVCAVARHGRLIAEVAVGRETYDEAAPAVTAATRFDLASLTKICATTNAVLQLVAAGRLSLDDPVQKWVPAFEGDGKDKVLVRHLLAHAGGLPAYERFYLTLHDKDAIVAAAARAPLVAAPGTRTLYSDLDFILLMAVVERCSGESFQAFVQREVLNALDLRGAVWAPRSEPPIDAMPTEIDADRGGVVRGYVHDENAFAMGGISGHAGLFATARDVLQVGLCHLGGGRGYLPRSLVALATSPAGLVADDRSRGLGWQLLAGVDWAGRDVPEGSFGHTGFTGTSLWCDPVDGLCVALLTNRVHPTRANGKHTALRAAVHELVLHSRQ